VNKLALSIRTAIERGLQRFNLPSCEASVRLLLMIAAHESQGFMYVRQKSGPALSLFQMEPPTYQFVMEYVLRTGKFPSLNVNTPVFRMITDVEYAAAVARIYLWSEPATLPDADDLQGLAEYASKYWNRGGKAEPHEYLNDFLTHVWNGEFNADHQAWNELAG
jgi:hypothetical protein